jgi:hypothetical protein
VAVDMPRETIARWLNTTPLPLQVLRIPREGATVGHVLPWNDYPLPTLHRRRSFSTAEPGEDQRGGSI